MCLPTRTFATWSKPIAANDPSTAWPCGSRSPALSDTSTSNVYAVTPSLRPDAIGVERFATDPLISIPVPARGPVAHVIGQGGRCRPSVPAAPVEPIAHVLLVER